MVPFPITIEVRNALIKFAPPTSNIDYLSGLKGYAVIQCLNRIIADRGWNHPYAAFRDERNNKYLSDRFDMRWSVDYLQSSGFVAEFQWIYSAIQPMSLKEFLSEFIAPEVHPTELTKTMDLLTDMCPGSVEDQALLLLLAKKEWLRYCFGKNNFPLESYEHAVRGMVSDEQWRMLGRAVNYYDYSYKSKVKAAPDAAHKVLTSYYFTPEHQILLYGRFREYALKSWTGRQTDWKDYITNASRYVRKCIGGDPNLDFLDVDKAMNEAADSFSKIVKPTDFLEAVLVDGTNDDSRIENGFVYSKFVDALLPTDEVLVVNPSPDWLCQYPNEYLKNTTFCVPNRTIAWVLEHQFEESNFITFSQLAIENNSAEDSKSRIYSKVLLFSREMTSSELCDVTRSIKSSIVPYGVVFALLPSTEMTAKSFAPDSFVKSFAIQGIDLLPSKAFRSAPKKKVFVRATAGTTGPADRIKVIKYVFFVDKEKTERLKRENEFPKELEAELLHTVKSIQTVYRDKQKPVPKERKAPCAYAFTKEIAFWYTEKESADNGKIVEAYVCDFPTEQQEKRAKLPRGKKVKGAYVASRKLKSDTEIQEWCENTIPCNPRIRDGVIKVFERDDSLLRSGRVTFKTLWYLQSIFKQRECATLVLTDKELFSSPIGDLFITEEFELIQEAMDKFCEGKTQRVQADFWNTLSDLLDYAVKNKYLASNPVENYLQVVREKNDAAGASVRAALMKKTFHAEEEKKLLNFLMTEIPNNSEYIGVLIRFLTGLEPNIVCALTWEDFREIIKKSGLFQFWIYQQVKNNGEGPVSLRSVEDFRRVPVVKILSQVLMERQVEIQQKLGVQGKEIRKLQIIASDAQIQNGSGTVTPRRLNKLSQKAIAAIGIREVVVDLPDDEHGTKETNLTKYRGDIFRTNFRYRANKCGCTDSERRFILGNRQITPFGRNYCDYLNEFSQLAIYYKLHRWETELLATADELPQIRRIDIPQDLTVQNGNRANAILEIPLEEYAGDIMVRFHCERGLSLRGDIFRIVGLMKDEAERRGNLDGGA